MFEPLNNGHAISEVSFFFEFAEIEDSDIKSMLSVYPSVRHLLPANRPASGMIFSATPDGGFSMSQAAGAEWLHFKEDGNPDWIARITGNAVSVHCTVYEGWAATWERAFYILARIFEGILNPRPILNIGLRYVDQFDYKGNVDNYRALDLFRADTPHIARRVMEGGPRWHNYTGWFTPSEVLRRDTLQQLNIDAILHADKKFPIVTISHATLLRASGPGELDKFVDFSHINESWLGRFMNIAHENNHLLLQELLTDDILKGIGLFKGE
nr:TIGR04255 family protein [Brucella intermedia]